MKQVNRADFVAFMKKNPDLQDKPIEAHTLCVMQYLRDATLMAYAIYYKGGLNFYYIDEE